MILGCQRFRFIHAAEGYVDGAGHIGTLISQRGSAIAAESATDARGRRVGSWFALGKREFVCVKTGPRDKRRAAGMAAGFAMAMGNAIRRSMGAIANCATKTSSFDSLHDDVSLHSTGETRDGHPQTLPSRRFLHRTRTRPTTRRLRGNPNHIAA